MLFPWMESVFVGLHLHWASQYSSWGGVLFWVTRGMGMAVEALRCPLQEDGEVPAEA